jgi:general secretion pathway protein N
VIGRWIFVREGALTKRGRLALAGLTVIGLVAFLPLRLIMGLAAPDNVTARSVEGSMWDGRIGDLRVGPLPLGTLDAGVAPLGLLLGRAEFDLRRDGAAPFAAMAAASGDNVQLSGVNGMIALPDGLGGLPVTSLNFAGFAVRMADGKCKAASGTLGMLLASSGPLLPDAVSLSGTARCEGGTLVVPMRGAGGMERMTLKIAASGRWQADLVLTGLPPEASGPLLQGGFTARPDGIGIGTSGQF